MAESYILSVSGATAIIKDRLDDLPRMTVEGEVSNLRPPNASGHLYFTLGDEAAKLNVTFFSFRQKVQGEVPRFENGGKVRVTGRISLYAPHGSYQLNAEHLEACDGTGELLLRFETLKRRLFAEGLCDPSRKRPLSRLPRRVGIVTAPTGAAVRDILNILGRRYPNLHIFLVPCRVQGPEATEEIARAIETLNAHFGSDSSEPLDAMIVGRGGGSLEDLWCFNEERVARAVAASRIPVISAVGHEPDVAITDFVADLRAPTPSAAAELICGRKEDFEKALLDAKERLLKALRVGYAEARNAVRRHEGSALFRDPLHYLETRAQHTDALEARLGHALERVVAGARQRTVNAQLALERAGAAAFPRAAQRVADRSACLGFALRRAADTAAAHLSTAAARLAAYNPYAVLARGYSLTTDAQGHLLTDVRQVRPGDALTIRLSKGSLTASVATMAEADEFVP